MTDEQFRKEQEIAVKDGYKAGKEQTIRRACEWLDKNAFRYVVTRSVNGIEVTGLDVSMTDDFRKAMEE